MDQRKDLAAYYAALELEPGASSEEIKQAYRDLAMVWHPDHHGGSSDRIRKRAEEKLRRLNDAKEKLLAFNAEADRLRERAHEDARRAAEQRRRQEMAAAAARQAAQDEARRAAEAERRRQESAAENARRAAGEEARRRDRGAVPSQAQGPQPGSFRVRERQEVSPAMVGWWIPIAACALLLLAVLFLASVGVNPAPVQQSPAQAPSPPVRWVPMAAPSIEQASAHPGTTVHEGDIVAAGPGVIPPQLATSTQPKYPPAALQVKAESVVELQLLIGIDGSVEQVRLLRVDRPGLGFEKESETAVRQWRYKPATKNGVKVKMWVGVHIPFKMIR